MSQIHNNSLITKKAIDYSNYILLLINLKQDNAKANIAVSFYAWYQIFQKDSSSCRYFNIVAVKNIIKIILLLLSNILLNVNISYLMYFTKK
jgi:hypothetical protein